MPDAVSRPPRAGAAPTPWHALAPEQVAAALDVEIEAGLAPAEAARRARAAGPNALPQAPSVGPWTLALRQFSSFIVLLLLGAAAVSWGLGQRLDALAIAAVLLINAAIGFGLDYRAEREIAALRELAAPRAKVRRGGLIAELPADELVPGDCVLLEAGDRVPADARLVAGALEADESLLTGESLPVAKRPEALLGGPLGLAERRNELFAGSLVASGAGSCLVTAIGAETALGGIGRLLAEAPAAPPRLLGRLDALGRTIVWLLSGVALVLLSVGLVQGRPFLPFLATTVALAIAAIPEGLPAVATLALAAGARRLTRRGLLLRRLGALEGLGAASVLCLDKTGTLTANAMTVQAVLLPGRTLTVSGAGWEPEGRFLEADEPIDPAAEPGLQALLEAGLHCNDAVLERDEAAGWHVHGDPVEGALKVLAAKAGLAGAPRPRRRVLPHDAARPWMLVELTDGRGFVKGAPEAVLARCGASRGPAGPEPLSPEARAGWLARNAALAAGAFRVLALAEAPAGAGEGEWVWLGLVGLADAPRPSARRALAQARAAHLRLLMLTGDQPATAAAVARALALTGDREPRVTVRPAEAATADVLARITPEGKHAVVRALQGAGQAVVMTGDGVNDAPALRQATVGVAMGRGADVAKEAADAVLTAPEQSLEALLAGVREGRAAFRNVQRATDFLLTASATAVMVVALNTAAGLPLPLLPLQILYLNLLTHSFPALGLALEPPEPGLMAEPPVRPSSPLITPSRLLSIVWHGAIMALAALALGGWGAWHASEAHGRTLVFATLALSLTLHALADRSEKPFGGWRGGRRLFAFLGAALALTLVALYSPLRGILGLTPLDWVDALTLAAASAGSALAVELSKQALPPER